jgi:hypothetical protein
MKIVRNKYSRWYITLCLIIFAIFVSAEFYYNLPTFGNILGLYTLEWKVDFIAITFFFGFLFLSVLTISWFPKILKKVIRFLVFFREVLKWTRIPLAIITAIIPTLIMMFTSIGLAYNGNFFKFSLWITFCTISALLLSKNKVYLIDFDKLLISCLLVASIYTIGSQSLTITNYPFSLTWSEGNRYFDYSLYFGSNRYVNSESIEITRGAHGRNLLWGIPFLIPNSPIWMHRLWNVILITVPYLLFGYFISLWLKIGVARRILFTLWIFLFLLQASIYTPLLLSGSIVALFVKPNRLILSLIAVAIAGFYASSSRWTWLPAPAAWATIIFISNSKFQERENIVSTIKSLIPSACVMFAGLMGGMLANDKLFSPNEISNSTTMSQPLLWYRLLPNATYPEGILIGLLIATFPMISILLYLFIKRIWQINKYQALVYLGSVAGFLTIGLVASVKIGGGNNLHNLDMFFMTLAILAGVSFCTINKSKKIWDSDFTRIFLLLIIIIPSWHAIKNAEQLQLPKKEQYMEALRVIEKRTTQASKRGEVLFLDQRQLLTFGFVKEIPLVEEYEKRFMMDKAMAGNEQYFNLFYQDLSNKRFSMIVTDPIFAPEKGPEDTFGDENNAWVKWVAEPLLCYYAPTRMLPEVGVQLLTPRDEPKNCPDYAVIK